MGGETDEWDSGTVGTAGCGGQRDRGDSGTGGTAPADVLQGWVTPWGREITRCSGLGSETTQCLAHTHK